MGGDGRVFAIVDDAVFEQRDAVPVNEVGRALDDAFVVIRTKIAARVIGVLESRNPALIEPQPDRRRPLEQQPGNRPFGCRSYSETSVFLRRMMRITVPVDLDLGTASISGQDQCSTSLHRCGVWATVSWSLTGQGH